MKKLIYCIIALLVAACANRGMGPQGGEKDYDSPIYRSSSPKMNETNFKKQKMEILFDEIIILREQSEKIIVSPPQKKLPIIRSGGRRIFIELQDKLKDSTTYVIDFSDAIVDNNENNPLENFVLSFSTGNVVDTLQISGRLIKAQNMEPEKPMLVGVHRQHEDTCFRKVPFERVTRCDAVGNFTLKNLSPGSYRIYALRDIDNSFTFNLPNEEIAFFDSLIIPSVTTVTRTDTLFNPITKKDSLVTRNIPDYLPKEILLYTFAEKHFNLYLDKSERKQENKLSLFFTTKMDTLPTIKPMNFEQIDWCRIEHRPTNDTIHYWITDSTIYKQDSLCFEVAYMKTDTSNKLIPAKDTLWFTYDRPTIKQPDKKKKKAKEKEENKIEFINLATNANGQLEYYSRIEFEAEEPIKPFDPKTSIKLFLKKDSTLTPHPYTYQPDSLNPRKFSVRANWDYDKEYQITIDSASITNYKGLFNNTLSNTFKIKKEEEYSGLFIRVENMDTTAFIELLNESDAVIRKEKVIKKEANFFHLKPGNYYMRLIVDNNNNNIWDTGKFNTKQHPESVHYYPGKFELRAFSEIEQNWSLPLQVNPTNKPEPLIKNKVKSKNQREEEDKKKDKEEQKNQKKNTTNPSLNSFGGGVGNQTI